MSRNTAVREYIFRVWYYIVSSDNDAESSELEHIDVRAVDEDSVWHSPELEHQSMLVDHVEYIGAV